MKKLTGKAAADYVLTSGRHKGKRLSAVGTEYLDWLCSGSMPEVATAIEARKYLSKTLKSKKGAGNA